MKKGLVLIVIVSILLTCTSCVGHKSVIKEYEEHLIEFRDVSFEDGLMTSIEETAKVICIQ